MSTLPTRPIADGISVAPQLWPEAMAEAAALGFKSIVIKEELHLDSKVNGQAIVRLFGYRCPECDFSATSRRLILHHNSEIHCSSGPVLSFFLWGRP